MLERRRVWQLGSAQASVPGRAWRPRLLTVGLPRVEFGTWTVIPSLTLGLLFLPQREP